MASSFSLFKENYTVGGELMKIRKKLGGKFDPLMAVMDLEMHIKSFAVIVYGYYSDG